MVSCYKKIRSRWYPTKTLTDADCVDDLELLLNTAALAAFQFHSLKQSATDIGLYVNANQTELLCLNKKEKSPLYVTIL